MLLNPVDLLPPVVLGPNNASGGWGMKNAGSSAASSIPSGNGQEKLVALGVLTNAPLVLRAMPSAAPISRLLRPGWYQRAVHPSSLILKQA